MKETSKERALRFFNEIELDGQQTYAPGEVRDLLNKVATAPGNAPELPKSFVQGNNIALQIVEDLQRGDVFVAPGVGGKVRPWAVTRVYEDFVVAIALSSGNKAPNLIEIDCRYWRGSWIGSCCAQFPIQLAQKYVTRPLTNLEQLWQAEQDIMHAMMGTRPLQLAEAA